MYTWPIRRLNVISKDDSVFMILGLTGAIGSGKSTVLAIFSELGAATYSADALCHEFYDAPDSALVTALRKRWGCGIFDDSGKVNRRKIGKIVFSDERELEFLTGLLYPELRVKIGDILKDARRRSKDLTVIEIPLLFEHDWQIEFDFTVAVWTDHEVRRKRLAARGIDSIEADRRERCQWSAERKLESADFAIINNGDEGLLIEQCKNIISGFGDLTIAGSNLN